MAQNALIQRHITAYGDYAMKAGGEPLFFAPTGKNKAGEKIFYNGAPGQLVAFTYDSTSSSIPQTVASGDLAALTGDLYIGVFVDQDGDGVADDVRLLAGEKFEKCNIDEASVSAPQCGQPLIEAATIDCVECGENYTVRVEVENNLTRSWSPLFKGYSEFIASYSPDCNTCDDCPPDANCDEIVCNLVKRLNDDINLKIKGVDYPDKKRNPNPRPFRAVRGHSNWSMFCFGPDAAASDCETCTTIDAILSMTVNGNVYEFVGNLDPTDNTKTLLPQLRNIAFQIEQNFEAEFGPDSAFAVVTQGVTPCCPIQLHVVTCDDSWVLTDTNGSVAACDSASSISFPAVRKCSDCTGEKATGILTFTGNAVDTQTVTIGATTYTFLDTFVDSANNVHIGATVQETMDNLISAITNVATGSAVEGTDFATAQTANASATAENGPGDTIQVTALTAGTAGNSIATTETLANASFGGATLSGGVAASAAAADYVPSCWMAIIAEPDKPECRAYLEKMPWAWYGVKASIEFLKDANDFKPRTEVATLLEPKTPRNFGAQIQWLEYKYGMPGGRGRKYRASNYRAGSFGFPDDTSRLRHAVTAKCEAMYCSYYIKHKHVYDNQLGHSVVYSPYKSAVHINVDDSTTLASWETFFNALVTANNNNCKAIGSMNCATAGVSADPDIA